MNEGGGEDVGEGSSTGVTRKQPACDECHKKVGFEWGPLTYAKRDSEMGQKIKCDKKDEGSCTHCVAAGKDCVTQREAKKRGPKTKDHMLELNLRVQELESKIHQAQQALTISSTGGRQKRSFSEVESSGPEESVSPPPQPQPSRVSATSGVSVPIDNDLLNAYFEHVYPFMPLIHRRYLFAPNGHPPSPFLLKAMYAAARIYTALGTEDELGKVYYNEARDLVDQCMDSGSLWTIHGLLSLVMYGGYMRSSPASGSYLAMAIRMAQNLRLYQESSDTTPEITHLPIRIQKEFRRRLWWFCYKVGFHFECGTHF
jgi:hypothetical protein